MHRLQAMVTGIDNTQTLVTHGYAFVDVTCAGIGAAVLDGSPHIREHKLRIQACKYGLVKTGYATHGRNLFWKWEVYANDVNDNSYRPASAIQPMFKVNAVN